MPASTPRFPGAGGKMNQINHKDMKTRRRNEFETIRSRGCFALSCLRGERGFSLLLVERLKTFSNLVVLPHSVFALPFALASLLTATHGKPPLPILFWVIVCMVLAR